MASNGKALLKKPTFSIKLTTTKQVASEHRSIMLAGDTKSGRTLFSSTFPDPCFVDYNKGLTTLKDLELPVVSMDYPTKENKQHPNKILQALFRAIKYKTEPFDNYAPKTIIIDSGSDLCRYMEDEVRLYEPSGNTPRGDGLYIGDYNIIQNRLLRLINTSKGLPLEVVWIFNITTEMDEDRKARFHRPDITGNKKVNALMTLFDEIYYLERDNKRNVTLYFNPLKHFPYCGTKSNELIERFPNGVVKDPTYDKMFAS